MYIFGYFPFWTILKPGVGMGGADGFCSVAVARAGSGCCFWGGGGGTRGVTGGFSPVCVGGGWGVQRVFPQYFWGGSAIEKHPSYKCALVLGGSWQLTHCRMAGDLLTVVFSGE